MPDVLKPVAIIQHPDNHVVGYVNAQLNAPTSSLRKQRVANDLNGYHECEIIILANLGQIIEQPSIW